MEFNTTSSKSRQRGVTVPEFLIATGIAGVVIAQICLIWFYSSRSFAAQMTYVDMGQSSQHTLDLLTREIRQVKSLTSFSPNQVVFRDYDDQMLTYTFVDRQLIRIKGNQKKVLLKDCQKGVFAIYQRTPIEGAFKYYPTESPETCKLVEVHWMCARSLFPSAPLTRESMQSAKIVIRTNS